MTPDRIRIFDTTLRDGEQSPGCSMSPQQKVVMARALDALGDRGTVRLHGACVGSGIEVAAAAHHRQFGSGPFFVLRHVAQASSQHRGVERAFDHSSAYGQWGSVMVELVVQHNPDPSALHDMFPHGSGIEGLHHAALFVDDLQAEIARFAAEGAPLARDDKLTWYSQGPEGYVDYPAA